MPRTSLLRLLGMATLLLSSAGCENNMRDQARIKPFQETPFFVDMRSARPLPPGTIPRGQLNENSEYYSGRNSDGFAPKAPVKITKDLLQRGRERYTIYCSVCHGADGYGRGIVVEHGFTPPSSYHVDRLRAMPDGYFFDVITHGKGAMFSYSNRVASDDRWAIVAYIRVLQMSQHATLNDVPESERSKLGNLPQ